MIYGVPPPPSPQKRGVITMRTIYVSPEFPLNRRMRKDIRRGKLQVARMRGESSPLGGGDEKIFVDELSRERERDVQGAEKLGVLDDSGDPEHNPAHFVYEVAQNAEDAGAEYLQIKVDEKQVIISHNGRDFNRKDVNAITLINRSSKKGMEQIGKFGIGFKSVFALTNRPEIHSGGFHFAIERKFIPQWINEANSAGQGTVIALPFKPDSSDLCERIADEMRRLSECPEEALLFLANLKELRMRWGNNAEENIVLRRSIGEEFGHCGPEHPDLEAAVMTIKGGTRGERRFRVFRRGRTEVAYLSERNAKGGEKLIAEPNPPVSVYFPTASRPELRFRMHIPYTPDPSRQSIDYQAGKNPEMTEYAARLVADSLPILRNKGLLTPASLRDIFPDLSEQPRHLGATNAAHLRFALAEKIMDKFHSGEKLLPAVGGGHVTAADAILTLENLQFLTENDMREIWGGGKQIDPALQGHSLISALDVPQARLRSFASKIDDNFFEARSDEWLRRFYHALADRFRHEWRGEAAEALDRKKFIRLENGKHATPTDARGESPNIYLRNPDGKFSAVMRPFLQDENVENFFRNILGLREPNAKDILEKTVIPCYSGDGALNVSENEHVRHMRLIMSVVSENEEGDYRSFPIVMARIGQGTPAFYRPSECYFRDEKFDDMEIPFVDEEFYRPRLESEHPEWRKHFERVGVHRANAVNVAWNFVIPRYSNGNPPAMDEQARHVQDMRVMIQAVNNAHSTLAYLKNSPILRARVAGALEFRKPGECYFSNERTKVWFDGMQIPLIDEEFYGKQFGNDGWRDDFDKFGVASDIRLLNAKSDTDPWGMNTHANDFNPNFNIHGLDFAVKDKMSPERSQIAWEIAMKNCGKLQGHIYYRSPVRGGGAINVLKLSKAGQTLRDKLWLYDEKGVKRSNNELSLGDLARAGYSDSDSDEARRLAEIIGLKAEKNDEDVVQIRRDELDELKRQANELARLKTPPPESPLPKPGEAIIQEGGSIEPTPPDPRTTDVPRPGLGEKPDNMPLPAPSTPPPSGKLAEEHAKLWLQKKFPGCEIISGNEGGRSEGWDLIVKRPERNLYVEVKGRGGNPSYVNITRAQWEKARQERENFWILIVAHKGGRRITISYLEDPYGKFQKGELDAQPVCILL